MIQLKDYDYYLPPELIAQKPSSPRDACRLMVYDTHSDKVVFDFFYNLSKYLPENSFLVLNNTKVLPSRAVLHKENGGRVTILFLANEINGDSNIVPVMADRRINLGEKVYFDERSYLTIVRQEGKIFYLEFNFSMEMLFGLLEKHGTMPLPLYIKNTPLSEKDLRKQYQTIFAHKIGSCAAPTASLHFTERVFNDLAKKGINSNFVTLNIGLGTFSPVDENNIKNKKLHKETWEIDNKTAGEILRQKKEEKKLIAVGTTAARTLESWVTVGMKFPNTITNSGETDLFIYPPYDFKLVDGLLTNFHLPKSSLLMLVDAFLKFKNAKKSVLDLYRSAIKEQMRFYSFGDATLVI